MGEEIAVKNIASCLTVLFPHKISSRSLKQPNDRNKG